MAMEEGVNYAFVDAAPDADPGGSSNLSIKNVIRCVKFSAPENGTVSELGIWIASANGAVDIDLGIYEDDGGEPGNALEIGGKTTSNSSSTWERITGFNVSINNGTSYWLAFSATNVSTNYGDWKSGGTARFESGVTALEDPWETGTDSNSSTIPCIYALYTATGGEGTNCQINIGDSWKSIDAMQINIGDAWKAVAGAQINIGDAWKTIF